MLMSDWKQEFVQLLSSNKIEDAQNLKFKHLPNSLFKYRDFEANYSIQNFLNNSLWAASADSFNDPYDSFYTLTETTLEAAVWDQSKKRIKTFLSDKPAPILTSEDVDRSNSINDLMEYACQKNQSISAEKTAALSKAWQGIWNDFCVNKLRLKTQSSMGVCSLSEVNSSMVMWRYYGGNHSGFCIEYDLIETKKTSPNLLHAIQPVIYVDQLPDMAPLLVDSNPLMAVIAALYKSVEWSFEREWRFIFPFGSKQVPFEMKAPEVKAIYFGKNISPENRKKMINIAGQKNIKIFEMVFSPKSYQLSSKPISI